MTGKRKGKKDSIYRAKLSLIKAIRYTHWQSSKHVYERACQEVEMTPLALIRRQLLRER
jgi:hypothetical protein